MCLPIEKRSPTMAQTLSNTLTSRVGNPLENLHIVVIGNDMIKIVHTDL